MVQRRTSEDGDDRPFAWFQVRPQLRGGAELADELDLAPPRVLGRDGPQPEFFARVPQPQLDLDPVRLVLGR